MVSVAESEITLSERRFQNNTPDRICDDASNLDGTGCHEKTERCDIKNGFQMCHTVSNFENLNLKTGHLQLENPNSVCEQKHDFLVSLNVICELAEGTGTRSKTKSPRMDSVPITATSEVGDGPEELTSASDDSGDGKRTSEKTIKAGKTFACEICDLKFKYPSKLKVHLLTHTKEKPYVCMICEKRYSRTCDLKDHMRTHTQERPFTCEICGSTFTLKSYLKRHLVTHGGEKPYVCEVCNMRFRRSNAMRRHELTHSQEKAFVCPVCGKTFSQLYTLRDHSRVHTDVTPYSCDICHKAFKQLRSLRYHNLIHTNEKPYLCGVCGRPFRRPSHVHRHVQLAHAKPPLDEHLNKVGDENQQLDCIRGLP